MLTFLLLQAPQLGTKIQFFRVSCHGIMLLCYEEFVSFQPLTPVLTEPHTQACPPQRQGPNALQLLGPLGSYTADGKSEVAG
jgi:hypothetical protein